MQKTEIASYLLFAAYLFSFLALTAVAARDAGRPVWLFGVGGGQNIPAMLFKVAFVGAAVWPLMLGLAGNPLASDPLQRWLDGVALDIAGHLLIAIGACIAIVSQLHMGASWRIGAAARENGPLVDDGPFAYSRNPVFGGHLLLFAGLFLVFPGVVQGVLTVALVAAVAMQVKIEERVLEASIGAPYLEYKSRVPRWFGTGNSRRA